MNQNRYIMEDISKRDEVRALIKSSGKIKVHLCEIALNLNSSFDMEITIDKSPSPKFTKKMDVGIQYFDYNLPLIDELMRRQLEYLGRSNQVIFIQEVHENILTQLKIIDKVTFNNLDVKTDFKEDEIIVKVSYKNSVILNINLQLKSTETEGEETYFFYEIMVYFSNGEYSENMIRFPAFSDSFKFDLSQYLQFSGILSYKDEILNEFLKQFPIAFPRQFFKLSQLEDKSQFSLKDTFYSLNIDENYFAVILKKVDEPKLTSHTIIVTKILNPKEVNQYKLSNKPIFEKKFYRVRKNVLTELVSNEDWEAKFETLGFRITEMFKKTFRKEYISLYEYKHAQLKMVIQPVKENILFSYSKRYIEGYNENNETKEKQILVSFDYLLINDQVKITFINKLMNFEYTMYFEKEQYNEENMSTYIDHILRSNAANVQAETLMF